MPIYDFECEACNKQEEVLQKYEDAPPVCEICGKSMKKVILKVSARKGGALYSMDTAHQTPMGHVDTGKKK